MVVRSVAGCVNCVEGIDGSSMSFSGEGLEGASLAYGSPPDGGGDIGFSDCGGSDDGDRMLSRAERW